MTFTSNGRLVSLSLSGQINIWDTKSGSCLPVAPSDINKSHGPFSIWRDDKIAMPLSNSIRIWDAKTGIQSQELVIKDHSIDEVAFTDDGKFICSTSKRLIPKSESDSLGLKSQDSRQVSMKRSEEDFIHIHNLSTEECVCKFECGVHLVDPKFSLKGQWITWEGMMLARWDPYNDLRMSEVQSKDDDMTLGFSADGTLLASINVQRPLEIKIWCTESTECLYKYRIQNEDIRIDIYGGLALTTDLLVYQSIHGDAILVWLETGQVSRRPDIRVKGRIAISPDGKTLATQSSEGVIKIWDLKPVSLASPLNHHLEPVGCVAPIADENTIISLTYREVKIWDISTGHCKETLQQKALHYYAKFPIATATSAPLYAIWSNDHIEIWHLDPTNGIKQLAQEYSNLAGLKDVAISANGERLAAILCHDDHAQHAVKIWDVKSATMLQEFYCDHDTEAGSMHGTRLAISPDGTRVVYTTPTTTELQYISGTHSPAIRLFTYPHFIHRDIQLAFHNDRIFAVTGVKHLQSFDHKTGEEIGRRTLDKFILWRQWDKSFINIEAIYGTSDRRRQPISYFTKPYYICEGEHWLHWKGDDVLWLPADYVPRSACVVGSTVVIGTVSGRVLFLYLEDQD